MRLHAHIARPRAWLALLLLIHCLLPIRANADVDIQIVRQLIADQDYQSALATLDTIEPGVEPPCYAVSSRPNSASLTRRQKPSNSSPPAIPNCRSRGTTWPFSTPHAA